MYNTSIFLVSLNKIAPMLQILGNMKDNTWKVVVNHAKTCALSKRVNVYHPTSHENGGVVFNDVGQVTGLLRDNRYILVEKLSEAEKVLSDNIFALHYSVRCATTINCLASYIYSFCIDLYLSTILYAWIYE